MGRLAWEACGAQDLPAAGASLFNKEIMRRCTSGVVGGCLQATTRLVLHTMTVQCGPVRVHSGRRRLPQPFWVCVYSIATVDLLMGLPSHPATCFHLSLSRWKAQGPPRKRQDQAQPTS